MIHDKPTEGTGFSASESRPSSLDAVAESFIARLRNGESPTIAEYVAAHPELATEIQELFPTLVELEDAGRWMESTSPKTASADPMPAQLGEYRLVREIGRGGMGVVYEAEHLTMRRRVALKVLPRDASTNPTNLVRFLREAQAAGRLHHTNIVPVFEVGSHDGVHYYAMQYIEGYSLDLVLEEVRRLRLSRDREGSREWPKSEAERAEDPGSRASLASKTTQPMRRSEAVSWLTHPAHDAAVDDRTSVIGSDPTLRPPRARNARQQAFYRRAARIGLQVAEALSYAHDQGILHRDIKPANLILDGRGSIWVTDFGLAKHEQDNLTETGDIVGTLRYLAPERLSGVADPRSDLYGLGLTLYELCTLRPAFGEPDRMKLLAQIANDDPPIPRKLVPDVPLDLETIILKAIEKQPHRRYESALTMADDLRRFLSDLPVRARRVSAAERLARWCKRNQALAGLAGLVLALCLLIFLGAIWFGVTSRGQAVALRAQTRLATRNALLAQRSEQRALGLLFDATRSRATAARSSRRTGQRVEGLRHVEQAVHLLPRLDASSKTLDDYRFELRNEAIACLANIDLHPDVNWQYEPPWTDAVDVDYAGQRYAQAAEDGRIQVRDLTGNQLLMELPSPGWRAWVIAFSPDGKYLAAKYHPPREAPRLVAVWDLTTGQAVIRETAAMWHGRFAFRSDTAEFAIARANRTVQFYDLPSGKPHDQPVSVDCHPLELCYSPNGNQFAIVDAQSNRIVLLQLESGETTEFEAPHQIGCLAWSDDAEQLVGGAANGHVYVWRVKDLTEPQVTLRGHSGSVVSAFFNHRGNRVASWAWDGTMRLWDVASARELMQDRNVKLIGKQFGPHDQSLGYVSEQRELGVWRLHDRGPLRVLESVVRARNGVRFGRGFASLLASSTAEGIEFWDADDGRLVESLSLGPSADAVIRGNGSELVTSGAQGVWRWSILWQGDQMVIRRTKQLLAGAAHELDVDANQRRLLARRSGHATILDLEATNIAARTVATHPQIYRARISPDARFAVTTAWHGSGVWVWDCETGERVRDLMPGEDTATVAFSRSGSHLAVSTGPEQVIWRTSDWTEIHRQKLPHDQSWPGPVEFSPDQTLLVSLANRQALRFTRTADWETVAVFECPDMTTITGLSFSDDGRYLAVHADHQLQVWDVLALRARLQQLGLDWQPAQAADAQRLMPTPRSIVVVEEEE
jgi:serine/threonine protein kinase/WD40 repeat protein